MGNSPKQPKPEAQQTSGPSESMPITSHIKQDEPASNNKHDIAPPPPRPPISTADYFSRPGTVLPPSSQLPHETNPFEFAFGGGGSSGNGEALTPGGTKLPSVAALTSPAPLGGAGVPPFWGGGGLRSGPLSPAMLSGPRKDDYFSEGHHLGGGFPTPLESSLRSGLTPGGSGSMFPEPSPGLFGGGMTPGTLDFQRTALSAAAATASMPKRESNLKNETITSQPQEYTNGSADVKPPAANPFDQHDANAAANGLYLLANQSQNHHPASEQSNHYVMAPSMPVHAHPQSIQQNVQVTQPSPHMGHRPQDSVSTASGREGSAPSVGYSDEGQQNKRPSRQKGKRNGSQSGPSNGIQKNRKSPAKKVKGNNGNAMSMGEASSGDEQEPDMSKDEFNASGKKLTEEEKRKNFLERNRIAALKCRQRKKQWLTNLQQKIEVYSAENDGLLMTVNQLKDEVVNLKALLLAHKDCPVAAAQGIGGMAMSQILESGFAGQLNPYGMAQTMHPHPQHQQHQQQQQAMAGQDPNRRFS